MFGLFSFESNDINNIVQQTNYDNYVHPNTETKETDNSNKIIVEKYNNYIVKFILVNNELYFVGKDICEILELPSFTISKHCKKPIKVREFISSKFKNSRHENAKFITELNKFRFNTNLISIYDVYELIKASDSIDLIKFKNWFDSSISEHNMSIDFDLLNSKLKPTKPKRNTPNEAKKETPEKETNNQKQEHKEFTQSTIEFKNHGKRQIESAIDVSTLAEYINSSFNLELTRNKMYDILRMMGLVSWTDRSPTTKGLVNNWVALQTVTYRNKWGNVGISTKTTITEIGYPHVVEYMRSQNVIK